VFKNVQKAKSKQLRQKFALTLKPKEELLLTNLESEKIWVRVGGGNIFNTE
jgi:hypothetical protein